MNNIRKSSSKKRDCEALVFHANDWKMLLLKRGVSVIIVIVRKFNLEMSFLDNSGMGIDVKWKFFSLEFIQMSRLKSRKCFKKINTEKQKK